MVSEIGFGCASFWGRSLFSEKKAIGLVHQALDYGINFFDTGASYGQGVAETRLGLSLKGRDTSGLLIATKAGPEIVAGKWVRDFSPDAVEASLARSRKRLGLETIPLFQLHGPIPQEMTEALFNRLESLRKRGWFRWLGLNSFGVDVLDWAVASARFDAMMLDYNILRFDKQRLVADAASQGMAAVAGMPLAMGHLSRQVFKLRSLADVWYLARGLVHHRKTISEALRYDFLHRIEGWTAAQIALAYVLASPEVSVAVIGTTRAKHLEQLVEVSGRRLPDGVMERIAEVQRRSAPGSANSPIIPPP